MGLRNWLKQELRVAGQVLTASLHDRVDGMEAMLHRIQQQNNDLINEQRAFLHELLQQNTHIANTQTSLLQAAIHLIEAVRESYAEIESAGTRIDHAVTKADLRRLYGEILGLAREVQETLDANREALNCVLRMSARFQSEDPGEALPAAAAPHRPGA